MCVPADPPLRTVRAVAAEAGRASVAACSPTAVFGEPGWSALSGPRRAVAGSATAAARPSASYVGAS